MIRQAISCDMCGVQKREANHWFIAFEEKGELRIAGWASPRRLSTGTAHLCGENCVHKLLSSFFAHGPATTQQVERPEHEQLIERTATTTVLSSTAHGDGAGAAGRYGFRCARRRLART